MKYFLYKLIPPRPTFPADITSAEGQLMQQHIGYWTGQMEEGRVVAFGPVADPKGSYGIGIIRLPEGVDPTTLAPNDPAIRANAGFAFEIHPMSQLILPS